MLRHLMSQVRRFTFERNSAAAVEFALLAPFFFFLFIGTFEILLLVRTSEKLNTLAGNLAEMVASSGSYSTNTIALSTLTDDCTGAVLGLQPLPGAGLEIAIASLTTQTPSTSTSGPNTDNLWEVDYSGSGCSASTPSAGSGLLGSTSTICKLAQGSSTAGGMLPYGTGAKGDNAIIVKAQMTYPGLAIQPGAANGWLLSLPGLTQFAFSRWYHASTNAPSGLEISGVTPSSVSC